LAPRKKYQFLINCQEKKLEKNKKGARASYLDISRFEDLNKGGVID
jgi:hypothetical protein